ncbi:MAG TPA: hypothetical protein VEZ90_09535 [Blastocatellia bacterium]|nr:hypothetical protein [Blastocatellia bacterium]
MEQSENVSPTEGTTDERRGAKANQGPATYEALVYRVVDTYIGRKLKNKYDLDWSKAKESDVKKKEYSEAREKIGKEAFLAVRSRTGSDFTDYFASSLCSVSQHLSEEDFVTLATALHTKPDEVRTLTLLALSARS